MEEFTDNKAVIVEDIRSKRLPRKGNRLLTKRGESNLLEMQEMVIPSDVNIKGNGMDGKNVDRVDTLEHACASPRCVDDSGVMVEELTVRNYSSGNLDTGGSSVTDKMHNAHYNFQHFYQRPEGGIVDIWEDPGSNFFPELLKNKQQSENQDEPMDHSRHDEKQPALLSPSGIRTRIISESGFSRYFVKSTLKGKGVICNGPARDGLVHLHGQNHPKAALIGLNAANSSKEMTTEPWPSVSNAHDGLTLREWLKSGQNKVDKSKTMYIFKQILDLVDISHSQGEALQALRPSCFKLMPSNQVTYLGSPSQKELVGNIAGKEFSYLDNDVNKKRELEHNLFLGTSQTTKRRKSGDTGNSFRKWPQFAMRSSFKYGTAHDIGAGCPQDSGYGFNGESIPKRDNSYTIQGMSQMVSNIRCDRLEEQWYASPEDPKERCSTLSSNIYSLGVLLFELLGSFESTGAHAIAMMDLRQRILPPSYLSENPREAGFCLWLLHPEPSLRPTTRDILQSDLVSGIQQSSMKELPSSIDQKDVESDLMLHFLVSVKEQKQKGATKLAEDIKCLEADISEIEMRRPNTTLTYQENHHTLGGKLKSSTFPSPGGSRLINNLKHLEQAYLSVRSSIGIPDNDIKAPEELEVLKSRENNSGMKKIETENKPLDRLGVFFNGLCKYARYSKFEVRGILRNGDFSSMGNVVCSLGFDRDEDYFATAGVSKKIKVYDFQALLDDSVDIHYPAVEMSNKSKLSCICWNSYIRNYLASTDYDGVVKIWDAGTGETMSHLIEHERRAWSVDFSRVDPMKLASGSDDCSVKLWSINEKKSLTTIKSVANVCCVQFSPYSSHLLSFGSADYRTYCYDLRNVSTPLCTLAGHDRAVSYVKFLDSGTLVSASTDNTLKLWDLNKANLGCLSTSSCVLTFKGHTNEKNFVGLSVSDGYIACGSETNEVFAYYRALPMPITSHKFGSIDPISGKETENDSNQFVSSVCWRQKSDMLVAANSTGCLKLLQMV
uniref:protein SPA1-RELATED 2-like n=1 Tax=Erigeron canadensis TaxID=72917 RepID=UPI001CB89BCA|nr:protein SPA1-RELATED 2-like [Erigeron canadensis]